MSGLPSGEQVVLRAGGYTATVVEVGGGLRALEHDGRPLLDGYAEAEMASGGRGQPLLPWPNRIAGGRYRFAEHDLQLPLTEPERGTAIHGLTRWSNWQVLDRTEAGVVMSLRLHPQPGYPFALELGIEYELSEDGLAVLVIAANVGDEPAPFGAGVHPYLAALAGTVDEDELRVPAGTVLQTDELGIPTAPRPGRRHAARLPRRRGASATPSSTPASPTCCATRTGWPACASPGRGARRRRSGWTPRGRTCRSSPATRSSPSAAAAAWPWSP